MNRILAILSALTMVVVCFSACNGDVFIDGPDLPQDNFVTIEGDGGSARMEIPVRGLQLITIDNISSSSAFTYYNRSGEIVGEDCPASELARISFESMSLSYYITFERDILTFTGVENMSESEVNIILRLEYDYMTRFITLSLLPGKPMEQVSVRYDPTYMYEDSAMFKTYSMRVSNGSSNPATIQVSPFLNQNGAYIVEPDVLWARYSRVEMPVPIYKEGKWMLSDVFAFNMSERNANYLGDETLSVPVSVPPMSICEVETELIFAKAIATGTITFEAPVSGRQMSVGFRCESLQPVSYNLTVQDAN